MSLSYGGTGARGRSSKPPDCLWLFKNTIQWLISHRLASQHQHFIPRIKKKKPGDEHWQLCLLDFLSSNICSGDPLGDGNGGEDGIPVQARCPATSALQLLSLPVMVVTNRLLCTQFPPLETCDGNKTRVVEVGWFYFEWTTEGSQRREDGIRVVRPWCH